MPLLPIEVALLWLLYVLDAVAVFVTYSRIPPQELYHVSRGGLAGGASRVVVFANFSTALVAIAVLGVLYERCANRVERVTSVVTIVLCAAVFWPGVVDQADLDAKPVNAIAAVGVLLALALTIRIGRRGLERRGRQRGDSKRALLAAALVFVSLPWIAAEVGFYLDGVPLLRRVFQTGAHVPDVQGLRPFPPAVHHGHHHGMDGLLLALTAIVLSRVVPRLQREWLRTTLTAYVALMFCYGIGNIANDAWFEQIVKRGWTTWRIPNVLEPRATVAWAIIVVGTAAISAAAILRERQSVS